MDASLWILIQQIGMVLLVPIAGALGTLLVQKIRLASMQIKGTTWEDTKLIIKSSVFASEQKFKAGMIEDKKGNAMQMSKKLLLKRKIGMDEDLLSDLIEAELGELRAINTTTTTVSPAPSITTTTTSTPIVQETPTTGITGIGMG
jgi:hypothetical protein